MTKGRAVCAIFFLFVLFPAAAAADTVEVSSPNSYEVRKLELKSGQSADVLVYLQSFGDMVDKYLVTIRREEDNRRLGALLSDKHGRVTFKHIPPGKYRVDISRRVREDGRLSTVLIGDVVVSVSAPSDFGKEVKVKP